MENLKNIFMSTDPLTNEEIQRYLEGSLSKEEMYQVELKMSSSDIYQDALEGLSEPSAMDGFAELSAKFHASISSGGAASASVGTWLIAGFSIAIISALGLSVANESLKNSPKELVVTVQSTPEPSASDLAQTDVSEEEVSKEIEVELESTESLPQEEMITYQVVLNNQPITISEKEAEVFTEPVDLEPLELNPAEPVATNYNPQEAVKSNVHVLYLHDLKVVDFTGLYDKQIKIRNIEYTTGTRAYSAQKVNENPAFHNQPYIYIDYLDYLDDAMEKYNANDFKEALKDYKVILKHFPEDINANFYGALCYYNLGKPSSAIALFDEVIKHPINSFNQEAEFYQALAYKQNGQGETARALLERIESQGLFYAKRARQELVNW